MKLSHLVLALQLVLLSSSLASTQPTETASNGTVIDAEGHDLQTATKYYISPIQSGNGGGLALASRDRSCPFYVMQENFETSNGLPLRFLPVDNKQKAISLSSDINIAFHAATICVQSTAWRLGGLDEVTGKRYVMTGGVTGRPGADTVSNWFKIEKIGNGDGYKILFCPGVCSSCKIVCGNIGVMNENGKKWLGLSDEPLVIMFKKT